METLASSLSRLSLLSLLPLHCRLAHTLSRQPIELKLPFASALKSSAVQRSVFGNTATPALLLAAEPSTVILSRETSSICTILNRTLAREARMTAGICQL
uniref:Secreted protein n=1 Tax=Macrostomum lignano TaxID=282301 RepID=A0A1I8HUA8_9PLAT